MMRILGIVEKLRKSVLYPEFFIYWGATKQAEKRRG